MGQFGGIPPLPPPCQGGQGGSFFKLTQYQAMRTAFSALVALAFLIAPARADTWWSLAPLARPAVPHSDSPWVRTPIDAFVLAKLRENHLEPAPEADRRTLLRRLSYDLHGLPPTPVMIDEFLNDPAPDAYERLVERLLASPRYGERWARHWLDVVHYGESHGYDKDKPRPHAWPYRDYVIRAFNDDMPYGQFVQQQLAGDRLFPDDPWATVATGFIAAGPWDFVGHVELREGTTDKAIARGNDRDDMVMTAMSTFLSLTVHCARCHDHKFDPITQGDYYRLQAVFAGMDRADRAYDPDPEVRRRRQALKAEKSALEALERIPAERAEVERRMAALPAEQLVYAAANRFARSGNFAPSEKPRPIHLLARGDVTRPGELVAAGALACLPGLEAEFRLPDPNDEASRRAALAHWITSTQNGPARRSIVNRIWQYHFGRGIVETPNDFGRMGARPTHPELLDWLAGWFTENGASLKRLHRLIVTSSVYRQSSRNDEAQARVDSDNRYLWRMNRTRLDAECVRDSLLAVSGQLDLTMGGPSVQQFRFKDDHSPVYDYAAFDPDTPGAQRRSVYRFIVRSVPDPFMEVLDCPDASQLTPQRTVTVTPLQALAMLNNPFVLRQCEHFAERVRGITSDPAGQVRVAYRLALGRDPGDEQARELVRYASEHGLANMCRVILNSNEFLFVD